MPGTIKVSVLDLLDLPSSSKSVKVSMGNKEHQIWDKGDFLFPVTTLRDNLIVTLFDIEGNELSRTGVNTKLVVEKGLWDDVFPLDGGGHLHMKLQFILSEEDRKRIREMRESAMKKKQELLINSARFSETVQVARAAHNVAAFNHEVTDSREKGEAVSIAGRYQTSSPVSHGNYPGSGSETKGVHLKHAIPMKTNGEAESSQEHRYLFVEPKLAEDHKVHHTEDTQQNTKAGIQLPRNGVTTRSLFSEGAFGYSNPSNNETDATDGTFSAPIPSQECAALNLRETTQQIPVKVYTQSQPSDPTTTSDSFYDQTQSSISQIALEKTLKNNETDRAGAITISTQKVPVEIDTRSLPTTESYYSQDQTNSATTPITLEKTPRDNKTDREGASSEATQQRPVKIDSQSLPYDITTRQNQTYSSTMQIASDKALMNMEINREGSSSVAKLSQELKVSHAKTTRQVMEKSDIQSPLNAVPSSFNSSKEASGSSTHLFGKKSFSASSSLEETQTHSSENQNSSKRTASNVRKMISALESSLPQEPLPRAVAPKLKSNLRKVQSENSLKGPSMTEAKITETKKQFIEREFYPYSGRKQLEVNVQQTVPQLDKVQRDISLNASSINEAKAENTEIKKQTIEMDPFSLLDARAAALEGNIPSEQDDKNIQDKMEFMNRQVTLLKEFAVLSEAETATISGRDFDDPVGKEHTHNVQHTIKAADSLAISQTSRQFEMLDAMPAAVEGNSKEPADCKLEHQKELLNRQETWLEEFPVTSQAETATISGKLLDDFVRKEHTHTVHNEQLGSTVNVSERTNEDKSCKINTCGNSLEKLKSPEYLGVEHSDSEIMGSWILPDGRRRLCITTGTKKTMDFVERFDTFEESNQREINLSRIGIEKEVTLARDTPVKLNETGTTSHNLRKSMIENSKADGAFGGFVGQAIRIAIMVAVGTLVVVSRQTKNR